MGVTEQIIFPEINIDKINKISGMDITFVTNANSDKEAMSLLSELGLPFRKPDDKPKKVEVKETGDSKLLPGEIIDRIKFETMNEELVAEGKKPASEDTAAKKIAIPAT